VQIIYKSEAMMICLSFQQSESSYFYSTYHLERPRPDNSRGFPLVPHYCSPTPADLVPRLGKPLSSRSLDGGLRAQLLKRVGAQVIAHAVRIPDRLGEQALHAIGARFSGVFGQLPPVFARRITQDALQVSQHPATWL